MYTKGKSNTKMKRRGVLALALLLIISVVLPQAALATDNEVGAEVTASAEQLQSAASASTETTSGDIAGDETVETPTKNQLENSGGGGAPN